MRKLIKAIAGILCWLLLLVLAGGQTRTLDPNETDIFLEKDASP